MEVSRLLKVALEAAVEAGIEILKVYHTEDFEVEMKSDNSPLTKADKAAHHKIVEYLKDTPYPILSEEGSTIEYDTRKSWDIFWLVDPLDGTKEFIKRNGEFTVNIALVNKGVPELGVVYVPVTREVYFADKNGAFKARTFNHVINYDEAQRLPDNTDRDDYVVVGSRSHMSAETEAYIQKLDTGSRDIAIVSKGSSLKLCLVAEGSADCYPRLGPTMEWDTAAGHAIARFSGKPVTVYGQKEELTYNKENLLNPYFIVG